MLSGTNVGAHGTQNGLGEQNIPLKVSVVGTPFGTVGSVAMTTKLEGELRREIAISGSVYLVTLSPGGFRLVLKGKRKGLEIKWADLVSGDAALAAALNASVTANVAPAERSARRATKSRVRRPKSR